jgi:hypothetical protein
MMVPTILHLLVEVLIFSLIIFNQVFTATAATELRDIEPKDKAIKQELWPSGTEEIKEHNIEKQEEEEEENNHFKISEVLPEEEQQVKEKEFIILKIYKSEIDKAIEDLKEHNKINQYYEPDYKLIVERYTDKILDVYGWYESLKKTIVSTDKTLNVYDEL